MTPEIVTESKDSSAAVVDLDTMTATRETLEDYTLRFAPRTCRRWSTAVVGISALGGIAYLADFAIGANVGIAYGTGNALCGIAIFAAVIFMTGLPLAYYAARYNIDLDLITRGSGFGYYGSVVTNVIFATFTFIFFALEGSIMTRTCARCACPPTGFPTTCCRPTPDTCDANRPPPMLSADG